MSRLTHHKQNRHKHRRRWQPLCSPRTFFHSLSLSPHFVFFFLYYSIVRYIVNLLLFFIYFSFLLTRLSLIVIETNYRSTCLYTLRKHYSSHAYFFFIAFFPSKVKLGENVVVRADRCLVRANRCLVELHLVKSSKIRILWSYFRYYSVTKTF